MLILLNLVPRGCFVSIGSVEDHSGCQEDYLPTFGATKARGLLAVQVPGLLTANMFKPGRQLSMLELTRLLVTLKLTILPTFLVGQLSNRMVSDLLRLRC